MANFEVIEQEGVRLVKVTLQNETVKTESGALYYMRGPITMESKAPSVGGIFKAIATGESIFRPTYTGSGELYLEPTFGGYHILDVAGKTWILEDGAYWASEQGVQVDAFKESTAFRLFLRDHLGRFGRAFATMLCKENPQGFFGRLGAVLYEFITMECDRVRIEAGAPLLPLRPDIDDTVPMACGNGNRS